MKYENILWIYKFALDTSKKSENLHTCRNTFVASSKTYLSYRVVIFSGWSSLRIRQYIQMPSWTQWHRNFFDLLQLQLTSINFYHYCHLYLILISPVSVCWMAPPSQSLYSAKTPNPSTQIIILKVPLFLTPHSGYLPCGQTTWFMRSRLTYYSKFPIRKLHLFPSPPILGNAIYQPLWMQHKILRW